MKRSGMPSKTDPCTKSQESKASVYEFDDAEDEPTKAKIGAKVQEGQASVYDFDDEEDGSVGIQGKSLKPPQARGRSRSRSRSVARSRSVSQSSSRGPSRASSRERSPVNKKTKVTPTEPAIEEKEVDEDPYGFGDFAKAQVPESAPPSSPKSNSPSRKGTAKTGVPTMSSPFKDSSATPIARRPGARSSPNKSQVVKIDPAKLHALSRLKDRVKSQASEHTKTPPTVQRKSSSSLFRIGSSGRRPVMRSIVGPTDVHTPTQAAQAANTGYASRFQEDFDYYLEGIVPPATAASAALTVMAVAKLAQKDSDFNARLRQGKNGAYLDSVCSGIIAHGFGVDNAGLALASAYIFATLAQDPNESFVPPQGIRVLANIVLKHAKSFTIVGGQSRIPKACEPIVNQIRPQISFFDVDAPNIAPDQNNEHLLSGIPSEMALFAVYLLSHPESQGMDKKLIKQILREDARVIDPSTSASWTPKPVLTTAKGSPSLLSFTVGLAMDLMRKFLKGDTSFTRLDLCLKVLENATFEDQDNVNFLLKDRDGRIVQAVLAFLNGFLKDHRIEQVAEVADFSQISGISSINSSALNNNLNNTATSVSSYKQPEREPEYFDLDETDACMSALRLLVNLTHHNMHGCQTIANSDIGLQIICHAIITLPLAVVPGRRHDFRAIGIGLLINIAEQHPNFSEKIIKQDLGNELALERFTRILKHCLTADKASKAKKDAVNTSTSSAGDEGITEQFVIAAYLCMLFGICCRSCPRYTDYVLDMLPEPKAVLLIHTLQHFLEFKEDSGLAHDDEIIAVVQVVKFLEDRVDPDLVIKEDSDKNTKETKRRESSGESIQEVIQSELGDI
eukprot:Clim_evm44s142 gene=Clim_evmTU44s142